MTSQDSVDWQDVLPVDERQRIRDLISDATSADGVAPVGDQVLREVALVLQRTMREADLCARFGGEEFVAVLPATSIEGALDSAERVRVAVEKQAMLTAGGKLSVTISGGVSNYRSGEQPSHDWLLKEADMALSEAKRTGPNRIHRFEVVEAASPWSLAG